jgi:predicted alpha/beta superfamily hydrolase
MKIIINILAFLLINTLTYGQIDSSIQEVNTKYTVINLDSKYFPNEKRTIKISLPRNYDKSKKYPVIYTLDGSALFEMTSTYTHILDNQTIEDDYDYGTNVIPPSIIVGIFHNDRGLETEPNFNGLGYLEKPDNLKKFIIFELIPFINNNYNTSGYDCIIGHSNTAYFTTSLLFQNNNPFKGIIALSLVEGAPEFQEKLINTLNSDFDNSYFLGYGIKDNEFNWIAKKIEVDVFNKNIVVKKYNANHTDLPASSLVDGIKHLFNKYRNFNDFNEESNAENFNIKKYLDIYQEKIKTEYGINSEILEDDFGYLLVETVINKNTNAFNMLVKYDEEKNDFTYQPIILFHYRKDLGDNIEAKNIAYQMIESNDKSTSRFLIAQLNTFSEFFIKNLKSPKEAVQFLEIGKKKFPESKLEFSYFIAKTSIENNIKESIGKSNLKYCIKNYKVNRYFRESDLDELKQK